MDNEMELMKKQIRENIQFLIDDNRLDEAMSLVDEYLKIDLEYVEIYSMKAVIFIMQGNMKEAEEVIKQGLAIDDENFDLNYNFGYLYEEKENFNEAIRYYKKSIDNCRDEGLKLDIATLIEKISFEHNITTVENKKKIVFFVKQGMDSFLGGIINGLSKEYETKKIVVTDYTQIDEGMQWADICWFEWCDELIIYGSNLESAKKKKIMCRLHSYEAFSDYPLQVNWDNVDRFICDTKHIKDIVLKKVNIDIEKIVLIPVGVNTNKFTFKNRSKGFNVAYVGYINYKKGPMLLIQLINALVKSNRRYKLFIGGQFQDERDVLYFNQMIKEMNLEKNIVYSGWVDNVNEWLEDKDYIVSTSLLEGQHLSVMEGMCKGIKPIIHNFVGAKEVYNKKYVWNSIDEGVNMIKSNEYYSKEYREFIEDNYSNMHQIEKIKEIIDSNKIAKRTVLVENKPLITIGITNYNYSKYLDVCLHSILNQTYNNIEIIIIDDKSTDDSVDKIRKYEAEYNNIKGVYHEKNTGACLVASNEILEKASGEYLVIISADDFLSENNVLQLMLDEFKHCSELDYVYGDFRTVDQEGKTQGKWQYRQFTYNEIVFETFNRGGSGIMPLTAGMYRMNYFKKNNFKFTNDEVNIVAWDTLNTLINLKNNIKYCYINVEVVSYRQHSNNMTYNLKARVISLISNMEYIINNFDESIYLGSNIFMSHNQDYIYYMIVMKYYEQFLRYNSGTWMPFGTQIKITKYELKECVIPLVKVIKKYSNRCLEESNKYINEINFINSKISDI